MTETQKSQQKANIDYFVLAAIIYGILKPVRYSTWLYLTKICAEKTIRRQQAALKNIKKGLFLQTQHLNRESNSKSHIHQKKDSKSTSRR